MVELCPHRAMETAPTPDEPLPPFCTIQLTVTVCKINSYLLKKENFVTVFSKSRSEATSLMAGSPLSETQWNVLIPVANEVPAIPPMPQLALRTPTQVIIAFDSSKDRGSLTDAVNAHGRNKAVSLDTGGTAGSSPSHFEPIHEGERELSPYFYIVELAKFSETFWQRYDQTWWFDKTKTEIINGMYRVVHSGFEPFATIATDTYAGCFRVTQCSLDSYGISSEPMLLEPLAVDNSTVTDPLSTRDSGGGLVRKLRSIQSALSPRTEDPVTLRDCSTALLESKGRLHQLLTTVYNNDTFEHFEALFGFPNTGVDAVTRALELQKTKYRASNRELALLLAALHRVEKRCRKVRLQKRWVVQWVSKMRLVERVAPELDCYPVEFFARVTTTLHQLVQEMFLIVLTLSSKGWLRQ